jgi:G3E family GTPase
MTLLRLTPAADDAGTPRARRSVTLLSGFLGSGKTTLLRRELDRSGERAPAVMVNDFGRTGVDEVLPEHDGERPVTLTGGCVCCTRREDLARSLAQLLDAEQASGVPRRDVVIETSGLSDPGPIAFTVANDPVLKHHYALARVCVTVDAVTGLRTVERHPVALRQLLAADDLIVTKADLAAPEDVDDLVRRLQEINPTASVSVTAGGELRRTAQPRGVRTRGVPARLVADPAHTDAIATVELTTDAPLDWEAFAVWLTLLLHRHGPDVLRVKGILDVDGTGPVAVHGVQHVIHRPEHLRGRTSGGTRLVVIVRDIDPGRLERSFRTFCVAATAPAAEDPSDRPADGRSSHTAGVTA